MSEIVEIWTVGLECGVTHIEPEVGDVFVYEDGTALMLTNLDPYEVRDLTDNELERVKERRWKPWMEGGKRTPPKSLRSIH